MLLKLNCWMWSHFCCATYLKAQMFVACKALLPVAPPPVPEGQPQDRHLGATNHKWFVPFIPKQLWVVGNSSNVFLWLARRCFAPPLIVSSQSRRSKKLRSSSVLWLLLDAGIPVVFQWMPPSFIPLLLGRNDDAIITVLQKIWHWRVYGHSKTSCSFFFQQKNWVVAEGPPKSATQV